MNEDDKLIYTRIAMPFMSDRDNLIYKKVEH